MSKRKVTVEIDDDEEVKVVRATKAEGGLGVYILIDRSGSMQSQWGSAIESINSYARNLAGFPDTRKARITVAAFDSGGYSVPGSMEFSLLRTSERVGDWENIDPCMLTPRGGTPLNDAIIKMVHHIEAGNHKRAILVVMTDGGENSSRQSKKAAGEMLDVLRRRDYDIVFLGASFDAFSEARSYGVNMGATINTMSAKGLHSASASLGARTRSYTVGAAGEALDFTDEDRKKAGV